MPSADPAPAVTELVFEFLERVDSRTEEPSAVLAELCERWPSRAGSLKDAVERLAGTGLLRGAAEEDDEAEEVRVGDYRLGRRLGSGGMGVVHVARKTDESEAVALKLLRPDLQSDHEAASRFRREMAVAAKLDHPNIVRIVERGDDDRERPFLAMELHHGGTLDRVIASFAGEGRAPTGGADLLDALGVHVDALETPLAIAGPWWQVVVRITREVARALAHAHARGVVHRDVKPSNVLVTPLGRTLLLDFGLASLRGAGRLTATGAQLGSLPYMSPEQVRGDAGDDPRTDVYSLAVTAYELLTLRLPYRAEDPERLALAISRGGASRPSTHVDGVPEDVAAALDAVLGCAMDVDPKHRYASADAFAADLTAILDGRPVVARPPSALARSARWMKRRPFVAATIVLAVLSGIGGPLGYATITREHSRRMEASLEATLAHLSSLVEATDGGIREITDGPLRREPRLVAVRLESTSKALGILDDVERDSAEFFASEDPRAQAAGKELRRARARLHLSRGDALYDAQRLDEALESYREHEAYFRAVLESDGDDGEARRAVALSLAQQARARHLQGAEPALEAVDEAVALFEELVEESSSDELRSQLAAAVLMRATGLARSGRTDERIEAIERALSILAPLVSADDATFADRRRYVEALLRAVEATRDTAGPTSRLQRLELAESELEAVLREAPQDAFVRLLAVRIDHELALALDMLNRSRSATKRLARARDGIGELLAEFPGEVVYERRKIELDQLDVFFASRRDEIDLGVAAFRDFVGNARSKAEEAPDDPRAQIRIAVHLANLVSQLKKVRPLTDEVMDEIERDSQESLEILERYRADASAERARSIERTVFHSRATARARAGRIEAAARDVESLVSSFGDAGAAMDWVFVADARAEVALGIDAIDGAEADAEEFWDATLDALEVAVERGFDDDELLLTNEAFEPLRRSPRFAALLGRL